MATPQEGWDLEPKRVRDLNDQEEPGAGRTTLLKFSDRVDRDSRSAGKQCLTQASTLARILNG